MPVTYCCAYTYPDSVSRNCQIGVEQHLNDKVDEEDVGRVRGGRERSIMEMRYFIENTVRNGSGQLGERTVENKELRMAPTELERLLGTLLDLRGNRCALTGIRFHFAGPDADKYLRPSVDRIDSSGHYERGNLQIVCEFVNAWKGDSENEEFKRLLMLVRGEGSLRT